jgi:hypothetical protein
MAVSGAWRGSAASNDLQLLDNDLQLSLEWRIQAAVAGLRQSQDRLGAFL